jgi:DNA-directed RNA polymerase specialized sigma24 family protein
VATEPNPEMRVLLKGLTKDFEDCWSRLNPADRLLMHMRYMENWNVKRLAERTKTEWHTMNSVIEQVLARLRACLTTKGHSIAELKEYENG